MLEWCRRACSLLEPQYGRLRIRPTLHWGGRWRYKPTSVSLPCGASPPCRGRGAPSSESRSISGIWQIELLARVRRWGETAADGVLGDRTGIDELQQVVAATGFAADARHFE